MVPLGLTAAVSATYAAIQKKLFELVTTERIISNEKMDDIMKTVKSLEELGLLIKGVSETIKNEQKVGFLGMLLGTLSSSKLGKHKIPGV